ncbi:MAG: hypothetical protein ACTSQP_01140 [Promethearchaeota archaeon]
MKFFKKKLLYFLIAIISLNFIPVFTIASNYELSLNVNDEFTWSITFLDNNKANITGIDPNWQTGMQKKIVVNSIEDKSSRWIIGINFWTYCNSFIGDGNETSYRIDKTPDDSDIGLWIIPTPVKDYLKDLTDNLQDDSKKIITIENDYNLKENLGSDNTYRLYEYDQMSGLLKSLSYYNNDNLIFKSELVQGFIPGYNIYLIIFISFIISLIVIKKRGLKNE